MTRRLLIALAGVAATILAAPGIGHAQTFNAQKFDIKGDGGTDYVAVEAATGRVCVSRGTHMMVVDGKTGKVVGDIPETPGVHGMSCFGPPQQQFAAVQVPPGGVLARQSGQGWMPATTGRFAADPSSRSPVR